MLFINFDHTIEELIFYTSLSVRKIVRYEIKFFFEYLFYIILEENIEYHIMKHK